jgi:hypothetical protein
MKILPKVFIIFFVFAAFGIGESFAQDDNDDIHNLIIKLPEVALLDLEAAGGTSITLAPKAPNEAGQALDFSGETNSDIWINYSSIIGSKTEPSRNITVQITSGAVPAGLVLSVAASKDAGLGDGTMGSPTSLIMLDKSAQDIITGVGSSYTGNGVSKGHQITYSLALDNQRGSYAQLDFDQSNTLGITYTLTDQ